MQQLRPTKLILMVLTIIVVGLFNSAYAQPGVESQAANQVTRVSLAYPTGNPSTSVVMINKSALAKAAPNQPFEVRIELKNLTRLFLYDFELTDYVGQHFTLDRSSITPAFNKDGVIRWNLGYLAPRESRTITLHGRCSKEGELLLCSSLNYKPRVCLPIGVFNAKLAISPDADESRAVSCDVFDVGFNVQNQGNGPAHDVRLVAKLPEGVTTSDGLNVWVAEVGTLFGSESKRVTGSLLAKRSGRYTIAASLTSANVGAIEVSPVTIDVRQPELAVTFELTKDQWIGRDVRCRIQVCNTGTASARNAVLRLNIPDDMVVRRVGSNAQQVGNQMRWEMGTVPSKGCKTEELLLRGFRKTPIELNAVATADCCDKVSTTDTLNLKGIPALRLEVVDAVDPISVGKHVRYLISVTNQGSATEKNVRITVKLDGNVSFVDTRGVTGVESLNGKTIQFAPLKELDAQIQSTWEVIAKANNPAGSRVQVTLTSDRLQRPVQETEATTLY